MQRRNMIGFGLFVLALAGLVLPAQAQVVHEDIDVYATGSGSLVGSPEPGLSAIYKNESICFPTACLYSSVNPGIATPSSGTGSFLRVAPGTGIRMEIVAIHPAVQVKVGPTTLDSPGDSANLGTASGLHIHPS